MLIYKTGDILKSTENIICHQVNVDGIMGGGLALQIANKYPKVLKEYQRVCFNHKNDYEKLKGLCKVVKINDNQYIANCFTQKLNFDTDYNALEMCITFLLGICKSFNKTISLPYGYGCGIAHGDWNKVIKILEKLSNKNDINISIYRLED